MQNFECLENIIGVTKDFCQCLHGQISTEEFEKLKISKSGLFLDEVEGGISFRSIAQIDKCKSFLKIQTDAIENAKKFFSADILAQLNLKYQVNNTNFAGEIGKVNFAGSLQSSKRLQFIKLKPLKDAVIQLDRMRVFLNGDTTTKVWIVKIEENQTNGTIIYENENVVSSMNVLTVAFNESLKLPLNIGGKSQEYYFVFENLDLNLKPRDIKIDCGCSGGNAFSEFLFVTGGEADNFSELATAQVDGYSHGFSLDVRIKCETGSVICKEFDGNDAIAYVTAFAILYKSAELVIENVLNSQEVNRFTLLSNERLWGKRNHFKKEYTERVKYLAEMIDVASSDCFICRENSMFLGHIEN